MKRAALGSMVFFLLAPGTMAGVIPWAITGWSGSRPGLDVFDVVGGVLVAAGVAVVVTCFAQFVREGRGTPAPVAPTEVLVVGGLFRYVRNPMYVGVGAAIAGQALMFQSVPLAWWFAAFAIAVSTFVVVYEQPTLSRQFGVSYDRYRREVPAWLPRLRPRR